MRRLLRACVHCGLCLNACPTYLELGRGGGFAARTNPPDQRGGERDAAARRRGGTTPRSLPGLPRLRDGLSLGSALRGDHRAGARPHREVATAQLAGTPAAPRRAGGLSVPAAHAPSARTGARPAGRGSVAAGAVAGTGGRTDTAPAPAPSARRAPSGRRAGAGQGGAPRRLRGARHLCSDERSHHSRPQPQRHHRSGAAGTGVLRRPARARRRSGHRPRDGAAQHRRLSRGPRRRRRQRRWLRGGDEGVRGSSGGRRGLGREGAFVRRQGARRDGVSGRLAGAPSAPRRCASASSTTTPVTWRTASRYARRRATCCA